MKGQILLDRAPLASETLLGLALALALIWVLRECYKIWKLLQEDSHLAEQVKEELERIQDSEELCIPINNSQEEYQRASCPLCHRRLDATNRSTSKGDM